MKRAVLADTGPLFALADPDDAHHRRAQEQVRRLARDKYDVLIAYSTVLEAYSLLLFRLGKGAASHWLIEMENAVLINPGPDDYRQAVSKVQGLPDQLITLVDAVAAVLATRLGVEMWTYDHHFDSMRVAVWR